MKNINEFINWYYKDEENFFITLINNKKGKTSNYHHNKTSFLKNMNKISYSNEMLGKSIYFTINSFKNNTDAELNEYKQVRKTKSNVQNIKSIVFDFDEIETSIQDLTNLVRTLDLIPSYILETSKNKFQVCFRLSNCSSDFRTYELINKTLAKKFKSDINVCSIEKVFRFPFFINRKNDFQTRLLRFNKDVSYDFKTFQDKALEYISTDAELKEYYDSFYYKFIENRSVKKDSTLKNKIKNLRLNPQTKIPVKQKVKKTVELINVDNKLLKKYKMLLKYNNNDASIVDILYIKERAKSEKDFNNIFNEILNIRDEVSKPLLRDYESYFNDRLNIFNEVG